MISDETSDDLGAKCTDPWRRQTLGRTVGFLREGAQVAITGRNAWFRRVMLNRLHQKDDMNHLKHHSKHLRHTARLGRWLPWDPKHMNEWLKKAIEAAEKRKAPFHPAVEEFRRMIENDPEMYMYFTQMFEQQPVFSPPPGSGDIKIQDYHQMLVIINDVLTSALKN